MIGTKFIKGRFEDSEYAKCAVWCNENNATIEDKGDYYECVELVIPLAEIKDFKIAELKIARNDEEASPVSYKGYIWDFDDKAQQRINGAIIALSGGGSLTWTSADNKEIKNVTADDLRGVVRAAAIRSNDVHVKYLDLKACVEACKTKEQIEAIHWDNEDSKND